VPATLETHGDIEVRCDNTDTLAPNRMAKLVFRAYDDTSPPFQIIVKSPSGKIILKRVLRVLPTGAPQSPPPIAFSVIAGDYVISISELKGTAEGHATLSITK
jgi:hypothetical protein